MWRPGRHDAPDPHLETDSTGTDPGVLGVLSDLDGEYADLSIVVADR